MELNDVSVILIDMKYSSFMEVIFESNLKYSRIDLQLKNDDTAKFDTVVEVSLVDGDMAFYFKNEKLKHYKEL